MPERAAAKGSIRELTHWVTEEGENPILAAQVTGDVWKGSEDVAVLHGWIREMGMANFLVE